MSIWKVHHGIMKSDAIADYEKVKAICIEKGYSVVEPRGKHWHKVEDATALMIQVFTLREAIDIDTTLARGIDYYRNLYTQNNITTQ